MLLFTASFVFSSENPLEKAGGCVCRAKFKEQVFFGSCLHPVSLIIWGNYKLHYDPVGHLHLSLLLNRNCVKTFLSNTLWSVSHVIHVVFDAAEV
jgi:hypothetical protein